MSQESTQEHLETSLHLEALAGQAAGLEKETDYIPQSAEEQAAEIQAEQESEESAVITAQVAVMIAEQAVVSLWPMLEYQDEQRERAAEVLAPVIAKHGGEMPPWLAAYKEEMQAAGFFAMVGFQSYLTVKQHNANLAANDEKDESEKGSGAA